MKRKRMTEKETERFNALCDDFAEVKSDIRNICTALAGSEHGAKGLVSQMAELTSQLAQHQIDDTQNFRNMESKLDRLEGEQKKLKWWAAGIATCAGFLAWLIETFSK